MMNPFSENLIFFDTEFSGLNPYTGEILSIGMVKMNGEELYCELEYEGEVSDWVKTKLLPELTAPKVSRKEGAERILAFAGDTKPYLIAYVMEYDTAFLYKLLGVNNQKGNRDLPYHWIVLDFASMLFALGKNPTDFPSQDKVALAKELGIDIEKYRTHHALDDAKLLREVYLKLFHNNMIQ
ncbi:MAG: 3'-5' exonuclease [bacterium]|nr:3'-5' exonuclease [bacterium]